MDIRERLDRVITKYQVLTDNFHHFDYLTSPDEIVGYNKSYNRIQVTVLKYCGYDINLIDLVTGIKYTNFRFSYCSQVSKDALLYNFVNDAPLFVEPVYVAHYLEDYGKKWIILRNP